MVTVIYSSSCLLSANDFYLLLPENSMAWYVLHVYTNWDSIRLCLWRTGKSYHKLCFSCYLVWVTSVFRIILWSTWSSQSYLWRICPLHTPSNFYSFPFHGFFVSDSGNGYWFWESDTINYLFFTIIKRMELMLYYWAYFCKTILSICMNGLKNMFSSGWKISELACCFLGRVNIDGSFCYSWFCNKATKPQRYCFLFCVFLIS